MSRWKRNLIVLCFAQSITLLGFSAYLPFIPYFVQDLGVRDYARATAWMAFFDSGSALAMMVFAPIWGTLADRYGRKLMLVRATAAGAKGVQEMDDRARFSDASVVRVLPSLAGASSRCKNRTRRWTLFRKRWVRKRQNLPLFLHLRAFRDVFDHVTGMSSSALSAGLQISQELYCILFYPTPTMCQSVMHRQKTSEENRR